MELPSSSRRQAIARRAVAFDDSNPSWNINVPYPKWVGDYLWRSSRDSNPGGTFMPYEISSHASSTSLSTAPYLQRAYYISRNRENQVFFAERLDKIQYQMGLPTPEGVGAVKKSLGFTGRIRQPDAHSMRRPSALGSGRTAGFLPESR